ncbi:glycosyltransferase family 2 protein [Glaciecola siphonariae]|uniref:Glycosyltransferase family 2 protein n=1 Tax=Glaciecola siphonariae TaxID=521012 RepID=A0ABV9LYU8_9ALTE
MNEIVQPRVKLVAIAKDEAAYLPEWIFHHKRMGFDLIEVYVNRTTDNSQDMLKYLSSKFSGISCKSADWIDYCPAGAQHNLQYIIYSKAYADTLEADDADYVLFLDIDEFWTPKSMATQVQSVIAKYPKADAISFQWINDYGSDAPFQPLRQDILGKINPLVKTLVKVGAPITKIGYHMPELDNGSKHILMDGDTVKRDERVEEGIAKELQHMRPVMIIHRLFRSPKEYVSLLHRGRPSDEMQLKLNRGGYNYVMGREVSYPLNEDNYAQYRQALDGFLQSAELKSLLSIAREFVEARYQKALDAVANIKAKNFHDLARIFRGCTEDERKLVFDTIASSRFLREQESVQTVIDIAKKVDESDLHMGYIIWKRARELRPQGPLIQKRIARYEKLVADGELT